jgi:hypothetical protein
VGRLGNRVKDWASLGLQAATVLGLGWLCWKLARLRRFYHDALADLMAEDESRGDS